MEKYNVRILKGTCGEIPCSIDIGLDAALVEIRRCEFENAANFANKSEEWFELNVYEYAIEPAEVDS